jgi:uncharacterized protein YqgQ
MLNSNSNSSKK